MKKRSVGRPRNEVALKKTIQYIKKHRGCKISDIGRHIVEYTDNVSHFNSPKRYWDVGNQYVKHLENDDLVRVGAPGGWFSKSGHYTVEWIG